MKKPQQLYDLTIPDDDFKVATVVEHDKANLESASIWIYLGANYRNSRYAKVGMTMGDLRSRSYSSANPNYFLLCVFQCYHNTAKEEPELVESDALDYLGSVFAQRNGLTKRTRHFELQRLSEYYYDISFGDFFVLLHDYLWEHQCRYPQMTEYAYDTTRVYGDVLFCEFSPRLTVDQQSHFLRLIMR